VFDGTPASPGIWNKSVRVMPTVVNDFYQTMNKAPSPHALL